MLSKTVDSAGFKRVDPDWRLKKQPNDPSAKLSSQTSHLRVVTLGEHEKVVAMRTSPATSVCGVSCSVTALTFPGNPNVRKVVLTRFGGHDAEF